MCVFFFFFSLKIPVEVFSECTAHAIQSDRIDTTIGER